MNWKHQRLFKLNVTTECTDNNQHVVILGDCCKILDNVYNVQVMFIKMYYSYNPQNILHSFTIQLYSYPPPPPNDVWKEETTKTRLVPDVCWSLGIRITIVPTVLYLTSAENIYPDCYWVPKPTGPIFLGFPGFCTRLTRHYFVVRAKMPAPR